MMPTQFQFIMRVLAGGGLLFSLLLLLDSTCSASSSSSSSSSTSSSGLISLSSPWNQIRGGGAFDSRSKIKSKKEDNNDNSNDEQKVFSQLAQVVSSRQRNNLQEKDDTSLTDLSKALKRLAGSQQAFKGLDGAAHEAYQRTHSGSSSSIRVDEEGVSGRASRSAARMAATAEGLLACELIELFENKENDDENEETLSNFNRTVLVNETIPLTPSSSSSSKKNNKKKKKDDSSSAHLRVLVLYESDYDGGAGLDHGNLEQLLLQDEHVNENDGSRRRRRRPPRGRLLVILQDSLSSSHNLVGTLQLLDKKPQRVKLSSGLVNNEIVSVQPVLYKAAGALLEDVLEPVLRRHCTNTTTAVHFVGQSLAGGVASLAATLLDGTLPMPKTKLNSKKSKSLTNENDNNLKEENEDDLKGVVNQNQDDADADEITTTDDAEHPPSPPPAPLNGLGRGRSSALSLGAPPCLSSNVLAAYCTSFLHGDDVVCRTSRDSLDRLCQRLDKQLHGGVLGRNMGWMTDTLSLTMSNLKSHAHGSEGEEIKLAVPGRAFLVRPRRLGGICSIHEVGNLQKGGREALRAGILWQLHDVLVSKSMWKHHELEAYIHGLDRIQLRGIDDGGGDNDDEMY